jgi:hypothetical protein
MKYALVLLAGLSTSLGVSSATQAAPGFIEPTLGKSQTGASGLAEKVWYDRGWGYGGYYRPYYSGSYRRPYYGGYYRPYWGRGYYSGWGYGRPYWGHRHYGYGYRW